MIEISDAELDELDRYLGNMPISCKNSKRLITTIRTLKAQLAERPPLDSDLAQTVERQAEEIAWLKDQLEAERNKRPMTFRELNDRYENRFKTPPPANTGESDD